MAQSDRKLTITEVLNGDFSAEYLDKKEKEAITERHIRRLAEKRIDIEDKISVLGETEQLIKEYKKITDKIDSLVKKA